MDVGEGPAAGWAGSAVWKKVYCWGTGLHPQSVVPARRRVRNGVEGQGRKEPLTALPDRALPPRISAGAGNGLSPSQHISGRPCRLIVHLKLEDCPEAGSGRLGQSSWDVALAGPEQAVCTPRCELWKLLERWAWHGAIFPLPSAREGAAPWGPHR